MHTIKTIFFKELKDLFRDKRTMLAMIFLPMILIPVVFTLIARGMTAQNEAINLKSIRVAIVDNGNAEALIQRYERRKDIELSISNEPFELRRLVKEDSLDFGLIVEGNFDQQLENGQQGRLTLFHKTSSRDTILYGRFMSTLRSYKKDKVEERLKTLGSSTSILQPIQVNRTNLKKAQSSIGSFVGGLIPVFFVTFCFVGALYPAIDLFTGEKERGTIETLLVLPSSRSQILIGKMLVIICTGVISGALTLFGIYMFFKINSDLPFISTVIDLKAALWMILLMIPLTTFLAGLLIPISIHARSFKEAQSITQPLVTLVVFPVIAALFSSASLNFKTAWIPVYNIALACKDIVSGTIEPLNILMVFVAMTILAAFGVWLARYWFEKEGNIFRT